MKEISLSVECHDLRKHDFVTPTYNIQSECACSLLSMVQLLIVFPNCQIQFLSGTDGLLLGGDTVGNFNGSL